MRFADVRRHALALPETTEEPHFHYASFRVGGRIFVSVPPDETCIHVFVPEQEREIALGLHPQFVEKLFWGKKVAGLRVLLAEADPGVVLRLVEKAWAGKAPKRLLKPAR